jgi:hypothetical protein
MAHSVQEAITMMMLVVLGGKMRGKTRGNTDWGCVSLSLGI